MHPSLGLENQSKWRTKINNIWYTGIIKEIEPPEPVVVEELVSQALSSSKRTFNLLKTRTLHLILYCYY